MRLGGMRRKEKGRPIRPFIFSKYSNRSQFMFTEGERKMALQIMDRLMRHPIARSFTRAETGTIFDAFGESPHSLAVIRGKLAGGSYATIKEWTDDVESVWVNAEYMRGPKDPHTIVAAENRRLFEKELRLFEKKEIGKWCKKVNEIHVTITKMISQVPDAMEAHRKRLANARLLKRGRPDLTEKEIFNMVTAAQMLNSDEHHKAMIDIITSMQPQLESGRPELSVDVSRINRATADALVAYMKKALQEMGMAYPEDTE